MNCPDQHVRDTRGRWINLDHELTALVVDAGGGEVQLLVDRDTRKYPAIGSRVRLTILKEKK